MNKKVWVNISAIIDELFEREEILKELLEDKEKVIHKLEKQLDDITR